MVNMLLFETKLQFASSSIGQRDPIVTPKIADDITNINTIAAARVSQGSHTLQKTQGNGLYMVNQGNLGGFTKLLREFWKQQNLRELSGNGYGCIWECYVVFHMFCPQFPSKTTGKVSNSPIHQGLIFATYIYPWGIGDWPAYTQIMVFTFTLWKSSCYGPKINWCH